MSSNYEKFSSHFLDELFKLALLKKDVCSIIAEHLEYSLIPAELKGYKKILKSITTSFKATGKLPTVGTLTQNNQDQEVYEIVDRILSLGVPDKEVVLSTLEDYIKRVRFQKLYTEVAELYNNVSPQEAIDFLAPKSAEIVNFSIKEKSSYFRDVFEGFGERDTSRFMDSQINVGSVIKKMPFGIDLLDAITDGGSEPGETECFLGRSGSGKTKYLRFRGISVARRGGRVLHIQAEGTEEECLLGYDATWTAVLKKDLRHGNIPSSLLKRLDKIVLDIRAQNGGIKVVSFEQFETASMKDVRNIVLDYHKLYGVFPDHLILDYLELFDPGNGKRYATTTEGEKYRREASARAFKNICNEFKMRGTTASQANDVSPSDYNRPEYVMTRHNTAGAKGLPDSFSYFFTWNVTSDEYKDDLGRLYIDKCREYKGQQIIRICTAFDRDRFYDRNRTIKLFPEDYEN